MDSTEKPLKILVALSFRRVWLSSHQATMSTGRRRSSAARNLPGSGAQLGFSDIGRWKIRYC